MHNILMRLTRNRPMRVIEINEQPYLERYYMGSVFGRQIWLHRFLRDDSERHLHNHPWRGVSIMLAGWYAESFLYYSPALKVEKTLRGKSPGEISYINFYHTHRIIAADPNTWTLMLIGKTRRPAWQFIDDNGNTIEVLSAGPDWWKVAGVRGV